MSGSVSSSATVGLGVVLSTDDDLVRALPEACGREGANFEFHVVRTLDALAAHLQSLQPDLLLLDLLSLSPREVAAAMTSELINLFPVIVMDDAAASHRAAALARGSVAYLGGARRSVDEVANAAVCALRTARLSSHTDERCRHYQDIIEASGDGIFVLVDGTFKFVNPAFAAALGKEPSALIGVCRFVDFVEPGEQRRVAEDLARVEVGSPARELVDATLLAATGQHVRFEIAARTSVVEGQRALVGIARDVTTALELQEEIERARKRAAQVERLRALGELAAGVAHDFNNTVGTILGRVELARQKLARNENLADDVAVIETAARNAAAIIRRIKEFSRPTGADTWQDVDIGAVVRDAATLVQTQVSAGIELAVHVAATPLIQGNGTELREVFLNLLRNALDAVGGHGHVVVRCFAEEDKTVVVVEDDGQGMTPAVQQRIFEPFFTTKGDKGTGLGLSVSHWILRRHDAQIHLQSEPGKGTTFRITFAPFHAPPRATAGGKSSGLTVLVVDDDPAVGDVVHDLLEERGHHVLVVTHPGAAAQVLGETHADILITDLDLPGMSGWQLAQKVRQIQPGIIVGLITGWSLGVPENELKARGVDFVLAKPFSGDALALALERHHAAPKA
jgi:PAS domain S-box-containing protein